jgi:hypothetical protein
MKRFLVTCFYLHAERTKIGGENFKKDVKKLLVNLTEIE